MDEAQLETPKPEVQFKMFKYGTEEEEVQAKQAANDFRDADFKASGRVWSEATKTDKCWYVAYCRAGHLVSKAVDKTTEHFKLNIPLGADYIVGRDWAECH